MNRPDAAAPVLITATLFGVLFLATVDNQVLIPLLPTLERELDVSMSSLGWLFSAYALAAAVFNLFLGPLLDRFGRVIFLRLGLVSFAVLSLLTSRAGGYPELLALRTAMGLMAGLLSTSTASFVGDFFPYERRGRVMGIILSSYFAALILGVPLGAWVAQLWDWRTVFVYTALLAVVLWAGSWWLFPREQFFDHPRARQRFLPRYLALLSQRETAAAVVISFAVSGGTLTFLTFISGYLHETFGLEAVEIAWLFLTAGVAAILGSPVAGWLSDRWGKRGIFLWANTALLVPLLLLNRLPWGVALIGLFFLLSLGISFRQTALHTLQTGLVGMEQRGSFLALRNSFSQLGISISVFVAGNLYSEVGYGAVLGWAALLTLAGSLILFFAIPEPKSQT